MPTYDWVCEACGAEEVTICKIEERDVPPPPRKHREGCPGHTAGEGDGTEHVEEKKGTGTWKRIVKGKPLITATAAWGPGKGYW